jgi:membrane protein required for beta-lactamase induction
MVHMLWTAIMQRVSIRFFYFVWTRASAAAVALWLVSEDSWIAATGVFVMLGFLFIVGLVLLAVGIRDLLRDFRRFLRARSHDNQHASV